MEFTLNGEKRTFQGDPELSILRYLRENEGITSAKDGCAPQAACGCCAVMLNGRAVLGCALKMEKVEGGELTTIEGMDDYVQKAFAHAFVEKGGSQCGFCIPGIVSQAKALIDNTPDPSRDEVVKVLTPHLCRCTGYVKIIDSVVEAARLIREKKELPPLAQPGGVGTCQPRYQAEQNVLGQRPFVADMTVDNMAYGALKLSDHPRAKVLSINTEKAEKIYGVLKVVTAKDYPGDRHIGLIVQDWPNMVDVGEETRYVGDILAGVVAEMEDLAREAVELIEVEYEVLEPVTDPEAALEEGSPQVHSSGNLLSETVVQRGDNVDEILEKSDHVVSGTYQTQVVEHAFMEPESCLVQPWEDGGVEVFTQGQGVYEDQKQIAKLLGIPKEKVRVVLVPNGGGFGGKEDLSVQGQTALMAHLVGRPVKTTLTRDESIKIHPKRHPLKMEYTLGCTKEGRLTALKARVIGDTGAYASVGMKVLERAAGHATGAYNVPAVDLISRAVYTNNLPCGAFRGFGANQANFAMESCIDELCEVGGFDRWDFRYANALKEGDMTSTGQIIESGCGIRACFEAVKDQFKNAKYAGIAGGLKNTGIGNGMPDDARAKVYIASEKEVVIKHGWTEMGQGVNTMAVQFVCEETGLDPQIMSVVVDTKDECVTGMTTASRATALLGNALIEACKDLKKDLESQSLEDLVGKEYYGEYICDWTNKPGKGAEGVEKTHMAYSYAAQVVILDDHGQIKKVVAAHDAGKIINPVLFEGQIEGSVHMGVGYAISEDLPQEGGHPKSTRLRKCGVLRAKETPEIEVIGVEVPDEHGAYGAKGVGEIGLVPTAPAVTNALKQFDGVRRYILPVTMPKKPRKVRKAASATAPRRSPDA